jgi:hypothetical protein
MDVTPHRGLKGGEVTELLARLSYPAALSLVALFVLSTQPDVASIASLAVAVLAVALCALEGRTSIGGGVGTSAMRTMMRDRHRRTAFLPQRDPDAAGRPRPRAPGYASYR